MKSIGLGIAATACMVAALVPAAFADEQKPPCNDTVVVPLAQDMPSPAILVDRCTGHTFLLVREAYDKNGATFSWRWAPIGFNASEAVLSYGSRH